MPVTARGAPATPSSRCCAIARTTSPMTTARIVCQPCSKGAGMSPGSPSSYPVPFDSDGGSWWLDEALAAEGLSAPAPRLVGEHRADIVVVGGGFSGLWAALALKER